MRLAEFPSEAITGKHAILSIPFEAHRDSRHNYKTQAEVAVYKNREESRDVFLYELRSFMNVKGKVLRSDEMEKAQNRIGQASRNIMNNLLNVNMVWFAQFFCDLLLQVGLSPVEETDKELLSIADKEKLQVGMCPTPPMLLLMLSLLTYSITYRGYTNDSPVGTRKRTKAVRRWYFQRWLTRRRCCPSLKHNFAFPAIKNFSFFLCVLPTTITLFSICVPSCRQ